LESHELSVRLPQSNCGRSCSRRNFSIFKFWPQGRIHDRRLATCGSVIGSSAGDCAPARRVGPGISPGPLTGPCVSLSTHTARATGESYRLLPRPVGSSCCQLTGSIPTLVAYPLPFTDITPLQRYYGAVRPWLAHRYFRPRGSPPCAFSLGIANQVLKFHTKARTGVTPPVHRTSPGQ
jgi:hypothetical protein